ncbi:MAG: DNA methyltransferase [Thermovirgaceae bacterium]|nr:DNA methyltransferase [Thermovirgaceae bacterium]
MSKRGVIDGQGNEIPEMALPDFVRIGMRDPNARMFDRRYNLGEADLRDSEGRKLTLPTETWRDYVSRRKRCLELREKLVKGEVQHINDLVTYNLDLRQFVEDVIANCEGPELLRAFWRAIIAITVLDPTCGSGAFLFAALNILEPLYEACLERMEAFLEDLEHSGERHRPEKFSDFRKVLDDVNRHPNRRYFILKSIVVNNLYGVDIMEEAVEICKLRLFLKLVAQVDTVRRIEPLPDIDFNIRAGNTLVGFVNVDEVRKAASRDVQGQGRLLFGETEEAIRKIEEDAEVVERAFQKFHEMQTKEKMDAREFATAKASLRSRLASLVAGLDSYLAKEYGVDPAKKKDYEQWRASHQPFHWFAEFYGIVHRGGFDVTIGNPPYVEVPKELDRRLLRASYQTALDRWSRDEDLYTFVVERSLTVLSRPNGKFGMILPLSMAFSTKKSFQLLRKTVSQMKGIWWLSHFDRIPSALFGNDVRTRCSIAILGLEAGRIGDKYTTALNRWTNERRETLFPLLTYASLSVDMDEGVPKVSSQLQADVLGRLYEQNHRLAVDLTDTIAFPALARSAPDFPQPCVFVGGTAYNWFPVWRDIPETTNMEGQPSLPARTAGYRFGSHAEADVIFALLASSLGYWWWAVASDGFNLKKWLIERFPLSMTSLSANGVKNLAELGKKLRTQLMEHYVYKDNKGRIGNYCLPACLDTISEIDGAIAADVGVMSLEFFQDIMEFNMCFSRSEIADIGDDEGSD